MPEAIRTSGSYGRARQRGQLSAAHLVAGSLVVAGCLTAGALAAGWMALWPAGALPGSLKALAGGYQDFEGHALILMLPTLALFACAGLAATVRVRARAAQSQLCSREEIASLREALERANALLRSERQVIVDWPAGSEEPCIDGDPGLLGMSEPGRVLAFGRYLAAAPAQAMERAVEALRARGDGFAMSVTTRSGQALEIQGRAVGGRAVLRLKEAGTLARELAELTRHHEHLKSETASLRALIARLPLPVWTRDGAGRLTFVNAAYARAVEAADTEAVLAQGLELLDDTARAAIARMRAAGGAYSGRLAAPLAGARRSFDVLDFRTDGGSAGIGLDATEAESMRSALARLAVAHRRTLDQMPTAVAMFDADRRLTFYNAAYRALWDLEAAYLDQGPTDSAVLEQLRGSRKLPEQSDFRQWKSQLSAAYRVMEAKEQTWHLPDGRTLRVATTPNPDGGVTYLFHDVTERLALERRFEELIRVQGETLDNLAEGVAVFASDGRLQLHNPAFARMWQLPPQTLAERPHIEAITQLSEPLHGGDPAWQKLREVVTAIERGKPAAGRLERRDGSVVDCTSVALPGGATLVTFHDVTDSVNVERALRERNEALEDADRIKINFVHHVSYELRSPLTTIIGFVHLLADPATGPLAPKQREYLDYITVSSNTLLVLINNILDLATIDAGRMQLNLDRIDIGQTMQAAAEGVQDRLVGAGLRLDIAAASDIGSFVADPRRLRQILFNLLANAASFSPAGSVITLTAERRGGEIAFSVIDNGPGIPPDVLDRVFNWFETHSRGLQHRGPGIGLSLVRSFVELHGGTVDIASVVGEGTRVTCSFPATADATTVDVTTTVDATATAA